MNHPTVDSLLALRERAGEVQISGKWFRAGAPEFGQTGVFVYLVNRQDGSGSPCWFSVLELEAICTDLRFNEVEVQP